MNKLSVLSILLAFSALINVGPFIFRVYAQAWVEGHITQDTTWTFAHSPYRAINDVIVDPGVLLTIEPGVIVQFADGFSLIVEGSLRSVGTESSEIRFTSSRVDPSPGVWNNIEFKGNQSESLVIEHSMVEFAKTGIKHSGQGLIEVSTSKISNNKNGVDLGGGNIVLRQNAFESNDYAIKAGYVNIHNVTILSNKIQGNYWGIYCDNAGRELRNFTIQNNEFVSNTGGGILIKRVVYFGTVVIKGNYLYSNGDDAIRLSDWYNYHQLGYDGYLSVRDNQITSNEGWGISVNVRGQMQAEIVNNAISQNEHGVALDYEPIHPDSSSFNISNNFIESNMGNGVNVYTSGYDTNLAYEVEIFNNSIVSNSIGVYVVKRSHQIRITYNSIVNNSKGIEIDQYSGGHVAEYNHIMENGQGIYISYQAAIKAEDNYWGHDSGPYHISLNPEGQGNSVNGDGTNLDFIPFSPSPFWPILEPESLAISVSLTPTAISSGGKISISVHVTDKTVAVSDVLIQLGSDKGGSFSPYSGNTDSNGDFDSTFTAPSVSEQTVVRITATASKVGYLDGSDYKYLTVYPPDTLFLSVTVTADQNQVESGGTSTITVQVTNGTTAVSDATVALSSSKGGNISPTSGTTDANGYFTSTYTAPSVTTETTITITANATKAGYIDGQGQTQITVKTGPPSEEDATLWIYLIILIIILATIIGIVAIARWKRHKPKEEDVSSL